MLTYCFDTDGKLKLADVGMPNAAAENAVIRVNACSICGTDLRTYMHGSSKIVPPNVIGHEVCGTVVWAGPQIQGVSTGDRVAVAPAIGCGECRACSKGHSNLCDNLKTIGFQYQRGFAEYMEIPFLAFKQGNVHQVAQNITDEAAALAEPVACVLNSQGFLGVGKGDVVAIFGAGFIGCIHAELALESGAQQIIMIEPSPARRRQAAALLPEMPMVDPAQGDLENKIRRLTDGRGADVVITACSAGPAQADALRIAGKHGRVSLFGGLPGESIGFLDSNLIHYKELSVHGAHASTPAQNRIILQKLADGSLRVDKYVSKIYPLDQIETALQDLRDETLLKAIIKPANHGRKGEGDG